LSGGLTTIGDRQRLTSTASNERNSSLVLGKKGGMVGIAEAIPGVYFDAPLFLTHSALGIVSSTK